ncbi:MAG: hypothetical protein NUV34_03750 [Sulfuricaulis sp.]|nr:hypothetical protein [Sulfuricaulis sp.]
MGYWTDKAEGGQNAEKMPAGYHHATAVKVVYGKKDGPGFTSKHGDPQIMVVFANEADQEAACMFTLSEKAAWVMAKFMECAGADLVKMEEAGVTIEHFGKAVFANKQIEGRECWIEVKWESRDGGKEYAKIDFLEESEVPVHALQGAVVGGNDGGAIEVTEDQIPF